MTFYIGGDNSFQRFSLWGAEKKNLIEMLELAFLKSA